jgi:hypothetical protein
VAVAQGHNHAAVDHVVEFLAWELHVTLGREGARCVGVLGESLQGVVEKFQDALVVIEM